MENKVWLDDPKRIKKVDPQKMLDKVENFPDMLADGYETCKDIDKAGLKDIDSVLVCGMGGSAVAGDILQYYSFDHLRLPLQVNRGYDIPAFAGEKTLVFISSYSGNTEETLSCLRKAEERSARIICLTSDGAVGACAKEKGYPLLEIRRGLPPRAAFPLSFGPMLRTFERLELIPPQDKAFKEAKKVLEECVRMYERNVLTGDNPAKLLAWKFFERIPVVYASAPIFEGVVTRWKGQLSENSKVLSIGHVIPEMNHNEIVGWSGIFPFADQLEVVLLRDREDHPQIQGRFEAIRMIIEDKAAGLTEVYAEGEGRLARTLSLICLGDFVSVYLAILYHEDPTPVKGIDFLKKHIDAS